MQINDIRDAALRTNPDFKFCAHHKKVAEVLTAVTPTSGSRLLLAMPPRFSKTSFVVEAFTDAFMDEHPSANVMVATATDGLATAMEHAMTKRPRRWITGVASNIPAIGASLVVIDDPLTHQDYHLPQSQREPRIAAAVAHIRQGWWTRLLPGASMVIVATRYADDDLLARLAAKDEYQILSIPAVENDHSAWPELWPYTDLYRTKMEIGPRNWAAHYLQEPLPG